LTSDELDLVSGGEGFFAAVHAFLTGEPVEVTPTIDAPSVEVPGTKVRGTVKDGPSKPRPR
jgi:DNA replication initiation complex subunit (GINS family)